jgi:hypothetical protein
MNLKSNPLQRKVYLKHPGTNFWDMLDEKLENIWNDADGDAKKLVRYVSISIRIYLFALILYTY